MNSYDPTRNMISGYSPSDGTVEFMLRVNSLLRADMRVLDVGAGRAGWTEHTDSAFKRELRRVRGKVARYIGIDVDPAVLENKTTDTNLLIENGVFPVEDKSIDLLMSDYVFEHISDPFSFALEIDRVLRPGGFLCARTPHKYHYVSIGARLVTNARHASIIRALQPTRKQEDVFPTAYRMNTLSAIRRMFPVYRDWSYIYAAEPSYYFGRKVIYQLLSAVHRMSPSPLCGVLMIFMQKP